jgi:antitoxin Phd
MSSIPVSAARSDLAAVIESAGEHAVHLQRHGRTVAVLISPERYDELMDAWEELEDVAAYDEAVNDTDPRIPWAQVKIDLGWT